MHRRQLAAAALVFLASTSIGHAGTLDDVRARGELICGVSEGLGGFSEQDGAGTWQGFDVDFCRAVAAAVLGDAGKALFARFRVEERSDLVGHAHQLLAGAHDMLFVMRHAGQLPGPPGRGG